MIYIKLRTIGTLELRSANLTVVHTGTGFIVHQIEVIGQTILKTCPRAWLFLLPFDISVYICINVLFIAYTHKIHKLGISVPSNVVESWIVNKATSHAHIGEAGMTWVKGKGGRSDQGRKN